jgi:hypothetical protein
MTVSGWHMRLASSIHTNNIPELNWWLINAFNGEWVRIQNAVPKVQIEKERSLDKFRL